MVEDLPAYASCDNELLGFNTLLKEYPDFPVELLRPIIWATLNDAFQAPEGEEYHCAKKAYLDFLNTNGITDEDIKNLTVLRNRMLQNPDLYVSGEYNDDSELIRDIIGLFLNDYAIWKDVIHIFDRETIDNLLRRRLDSAEEYIGSLSLFSQETKELLKGMVQSVNIDGNPFSSAQKIEFIDLLNAYQASKIPYSRIE